MLPKQNAQEFVRKKAFEISYALFRMAAVVKNRNFAETLEAKAVALLDAAYDLESGNAESVLGAIAYFVRFGTEAGLVYPRNSELLSKETDILRTAIQRSLETAEELPEVDFAGLFSKYVAERSSIPATVKRQSSSENRDFAGKERQTAILERIRQSGNPSVVRTDLQDGCRIADLQEAFPGISERTLRYDIEHLIASGVVERIGSGKATFYRPKTVQESVISLPGTGNHLGVSQ